ncbi:BTB-domain-containing protein [Gigaspora margarita]|uniref:BTB-domain-containing protein n=1 Tax=Gigaspora margarita TaxID=4874 RepID=A0A8H3X6X4_GIGMA|nr:BTB-domain-containing protein [Gigaspora margarita]
MTDSEYYNCLSRDILKLLEDPRDYDMIITVGEDPDIKTYFVHSNILRVRSDYFKTALSSGWVKKENETIQFTKPNISPAVFDIILRFIYGANSDNFVGGYNPEVWDSPLWPNYKSSDKAFIFSFTQGGTNLNGQGNNNGKIGRVIDNVYALNCWRFNGPSFGKYDLVMHYGGFLRFKHQTFSPQVLPIDNALMRIEDYEVFEVIS